ncbi:MAG: two-component system histidine kinase PnpS [Desulfuromonadales bacterium]
MARTRLLWQFLAPFLLITLLALLTATWLFSRTLEQFHGEQTRKELEARARVVAVQALAPLKRGDAAVADALCKQLGGLSLTRLTIILPGGRVLGDSSEDPARMENHADRPEFTAALGGTVGIDSRLSHTVQQKMMYVAVPVSEGGRVIGSVRASLSLARIDRTRQAVVAQVIGIALAVALGAAVISLWIARRITRPLEEMRDGAQRFARGELDRRLPLYRSEELAGLAGAMNQMAAQLDERIRAVVGQRNEQEAVLASMIEGVLAIDRNEKLLRINQAAASMLDLQPEAAVGRRIQEVLRKPDLQKFVTEALQSKVPTEAEMRLMIRGEERFLQTHGAPLRDAAGQEIGVLVVLNDITRLQRLENIRRDFVANVSHELKTPITAIKGSVETLLGGAIDEADSAPRFLDIIARQADRLNAIIEDLLALSRIEQEEEKVGIQLTPVPVEEVIQGALQSCQVTARDKQVRLTVDCPANLRCRANAPLLEQALVNLIDNAIKYSSEGGKVQLAAHPVEEGLEITVRDFGCGIERQHLPRLFERFYRVDKARSRKQGGTGLGLAIVKHIIQAHGGQVRVDSTPGEGSLFTITLPGTRSNHS